MTPENPNLGTGATGGIFATTHWTVVLAAGRCDSREAHLALEELCRTYWYPLYAYVRLQGHSREDAEDLTQGFFARLLEKNYLEEGVPKVFVRSSIDGGYADTSGVLCRRV